MQPQSTIRHAESVALPFYGAELSRKDGLPTSKEPEAMPVVRGKEIEVFYSASTIARRNLELAKQVAERDYEDLLVISILKGSFIFAADLIRAMYDVGISPEVEFMMISSYGAGTTSGEIKVQRDIDNDVAGRDILLIDDI